MLLYITIRVYRPLMKHHLPALGENQLKQYHRIIKQIKMIKWLTQFFMLTNNTQIILLLCINT